MPVFGLCHFYISERYATHIWKYVPTFTIQTAVINYEKKFIKPTHCH